ncbi:Protein SCO1, mitochondrial [Tolypocladium ophioglossoides CBS 100239]|uniref:Protein SCO1, mitochondrial n=1 Tax=Tolypocladium ophioglossoides (strain CBS 100239) TaxID=1163406 RepID=A0A0L0N1P9_TOLOC|nr:Protein SCO1, mitochondrial [Tolypocladium ophioglossoides CBS 100239]
MFPLNHLVSYNPNWLAPIDPPSSTPNDDSPCRQRDRHVAFGRIIKGPAGRIQQAVCSPMPALFLERRGAADAAEAASSDASSRPGTVETTDYAKTVQVQNSRTGQEPAQHRGILFVATCAGLLWYFEFEKGRMQRKRIADAAKGVGRPKVGGEFELVDQDGKPFTSQMMKGKYSLVYFDFTRCPDICPEELDKMARMLDVVGDKAPGSLLPIFVTCDPERDDPKALKSYLAEFHPAFIGLTGTYEQIKDLCKKYRVYFSTPQNVKPGQDYLVDHSIYFYLMDPEGDFVEALGRQHSPDQGAQLILDHMKDWKGRRQFGNSAALNERNVSGSRSAVPQRSIGKAKSTSGQDASHSAFSDIAFAFDIDGVLYQGQQGIPGAREMLRSIRSHGIRYVFLTNGGGAHEDDKVASLTKRLQMSPDEDVIRNRVIVSHTPMRGWDDAVKNQTVLITGSHPETAREIANEYGFSRAVTPADLIHANGTIYPFDNLKDSVHAQFRKLPDGKSASRITDSYSRDIAADALKIDQILVWNDPRDWSLDIQIIHDLLVSHRGYLGTVSEKNGDASLPHNGWQQDGQPELWISNLDLFWKTEYPVNRFGTGAFVEALRGPSKFTYDYAHDRLLHYYADMLAAEGKRAADRTRHPLRRVYMIGDNPESEIRGANEFDAGDGTEWVSILVRTGVWQQTATEREPRHRPAVVVDDVVDAIVWALRNEGVEATRERLTGGKW